MIDSWQWERILRACAIQVGEVHTHPFAAVRLRDHDRVRVPGRVQHLSDHPSLLQLVDLLDSEVVSVLRMPAHLLLDGARIRARREVMLNHLPLAPQGDQMIFKRTHQHSPKESVTPRSGDRDIPYISPRSTEHMKA